MIRQLAAQFKEIRVKLETASCQSCADLRSQDPSVGALVPTDSGILVVAIK